MFESLDSKKFRIVVIVLAIFIILEIVGFGFWWYFSRTQKKRIIVPPSSLPTSMPQPTSTLQEAHKWELLRNKGWKIYRESCGGFLFTIPYPSTLTIGTQEESDLGVFRAINFYPASQKENKLPIFQIKTYLHTASDLLSFEEQKTANKVQISKYEGWRLTKEENGQKVVEVYIPLKPTSLVVLLKGYVYPEDQVSFDTSVVIEEMINNFQVEEFLEKQ